MKTLTSTLEAAQQSNSGAPYVEALLADYWGYARRARPERVYTGAEASDPVAAALSPDGSLVRLRRETDAVTLALQVGASADDSYENTGTNTPTDQEPLADATDEYVGVRFQGVTIAQGATILHAVLSFVNSGDGGGNPEGTARTPTTRRRSPVERTTSPAGRRRRRRLRSTLRRSCKTTPTLRTSPTSRRSSRRSSIGAAGPAATRWR